MQQTHHGWVVAKRVLMFFLIVGSASASDQEGSSSAVRDNHAVGDTYTNGLDMIFNKISSGTFMMGSPADEVGRDSDEGPQHQVTIRQPFYMQTTEVTQGQWQAVMGANPSRFSNCGARCPVEQVSWEDVQGFIVKLNRRGEGRYRLPTEAEWEYAARAGTTTPFSFGPTIHASTEANYDGSSPYGKGRRGKYWRSTTPVGHFPANPWGLYDMHGNVYEWVQDSHAKDAYRTHARHDPLHEENGADRVIRGGSWVDDAGNLRSAYRFQRNPTSRYFYLGFRLVFVPSGG